MCDKKEEKWLSDEGVVDLNDIQNGKLKCTPSRRRGYGMEENCILLWNQVFRNCNSRW